MTQSDFCVSEQRIVEFDHIVEPKTYEEGQMLFYRDNSRLEIFNN